MGQKRPKRLSKSEEKLLFIKYESLLRNKKYLKIYYEQFPKFERWMEKLRKRDWNRWSICMETHRDLLRRCFGINDYVHPSKSFAQLSPVEKVGLYDPAPVRCLTNEFEFVKPAFSSIKNPLDAFGIEAPIAVKELAKLDTITVELNLLHGETEIKNGVIQVFKRWKDRKKKYDTYLQKTALEDVKRDFDIYDFAETYKRKHGTISWVKVAEKFHPGEERSVEKRGPETKVKTAYKRALRRIGEAVVITNLK